MNDTDAISYHLIDSDAALADFVPILRRAGRIAVDLEADSMYHFREKVCLIQIGANGTNAVIDPLNVTGLESLRPVFADPAVEKIFHGADYDVRSLYRDFGIEIDNLFDTQIACRFLGMRETGLEAAVSGLFGVSLDKKYQKKDWSRRPLPPEMIDYAAHDVIHLVPLADRLKADLETKGRLDWVAEECRILSGVRYPPDEHEPLYLRFKGAGRLDPRSLAILEAVLQFRRVAAERKDRPLFKVFGNEAIQQVVKTRPTSLNRLAASGALSQKQTRMYGEEIVAAVQTALDLLDDDLPIYPRRRSQATSPRAPERVRVLKRWRDETADRLDLDPAVVLTKSLIQAIAVQNPQDEAALGQVGEIRTWQVEAFGAEILERLRSIEDKPKRRKKRRRRRRKK